MFKVQVFNNISDTGLKQFPRELYDTSSNVINPEIILLRSQDLHSIPLPNSLLAIGRAGTGINNIPVSQMTKRGVVVFNTPGANANAVRELVITGMLVASRHLCDAWAFLQNLSVNDDAELTTAIERQKNQYVGNELFGKNLGIIGLGSIGVKVANSGLNLGMRVIGYDPAISVNRAWELSSTVMQAHSLEELLKISDYVSIHVPLSPTTKHLINEANIKLLPEHAILLNFSREEIVDPNAILNALNQKKLLKYVSDFPTHALKNHPGTLFFPHLGASTKEAEENCAIMIVKQVRDFIEHGAITYSANFPTVDVGRQYQGVRLAIVNENIPRMVAQISEKLANKGLNILSLINQSRDDIAYTLIDVETPVDATLLEDIRHIQGVLQVRQLG